MSNSNNINCTAKKPYRPVVIVHGLMTGDVSTMQHLANCITELHPGTKTYVINRFCGLASLEPLWRQTRQLADDLLRVCSLHPEGVHLIGYSQGGLIARGMLETYGAEHNVRTFVSLSSPQGGQYGAECFTKMFPALTTRTAYEVFYTRLGQYALSVANYWYDPRHRDLYLKYSVYLAVIDNVKNQESRIGLQQKPMVVVSNEDKNFASIFSTTKKNILDNTTITQTNDAMSKMLEERVTIAIDAVNAATVKVAEGHAGDDNGDVNYGTTGAAVDAVMSKILDINSDGYYQGGYSKVDENPNPNTSSKKLGLTRLQRLVLIGGPDDGVISPWQSSQFAVLDNAGELIPVRERQQNDVFSEEDPIGLRQLDMTGRLVEYTVPGVGHHEWHCNERVLHECIIDWLD